MSLYSADQIIGKSLYAKTAVKLKRIAQDSAPDIYTVNPGQLVGIVYSYVMPSADRATLYWQFLDANGRAYYAAHTPTSFSLTKLAEQGALSVKEEAAAAAAAAETTPQKIERLFKYSLWIIAGAVVLKSIAPDLIKKFK